MKNKNPLRKIALDISNYNKEEYRVVQEEQ